MAEWWSCSLLLAKPRGGEEKECRAGHAQGRGGRGKSVGLVARVSGDGVVVPVERIGRRKEGRTMELLMVFVGGDGGL